MASSNYLLKTLTEIIAKSDPKIVAGCPYQGVSTKDYKNCS